MSVRSVLSPSPSPDPPSAQRLTGPRSLLAWRWLTWRRLLPALPILLAGLYLVVLLIDFRPVITSINTFGDAVIAPVLAKLAGQAPPGSQVVLGHHPYYEEYLFLRATAGLPFYRVLWEIAPLVWTLSGVAMLAWSAGQALGRVAAVLTASALLCLGTLGRFVFFTFNWHGLTVVHTILVGCALVWLAPRADRISWRRLLIVAVMLGLLSALPAASDVLFLVWALVPMAIAAGLLALQGRGRARWTPTAFVLVTGLVSMLVGMVIDQVMRASDITARAFPFSVASPAGVAHNLPLLGQSLLALGGGNLTAPFHGFARYPRLISGILLVAALGLTAAVTARLARRAVRRLGDRPPRPAPDTGPMSSAGAPQRLVYLAFWASSLVVTCVAYVASSVPKVTTASSRYALAAYVAIMALFPVMALRGPRWRRWISAGVCVFILSAIVELGVAPFVRFGPYPTPAVASRVLAFARAHGVRYGYAGYWDAPSITWMTDFRLQIYPIKDGCSPYVACPARTARISTWYGWRPSTRSMLIADSASSDFPSLDARLGPPLASTRIGTMTVAVYSYDIASELRNPVLPWFQ